MKTNIYLSGKCLTLSQESVKSSTDVYCLANFSNIHWLTRKHSLRIFLKTIKTFSMFSSKLWHWIVSNNSFCFTLFSNVYWQASIFWAFSCCHNLLKTRIAKEKIIENILKRSNIICLPEANKFCQENVWQTCLMDSAKIDWEGNL